MTDEIEFEREPDERVEHQVDRELLSQSVMFVSDWTVETIVGQLRANNISLDPRFQRRDAWRLDRKSQFVESVLLGLPIPQIVLAERKDKKGQFLVLDGKQRLMTLLQFFGAAKESKNNGFALRGLEILDELDGATFETLKRTEHLSSFLNYTIRSSVIRNWPSEKFLELVFVRLNQGSVRLSPQELRQALYPGPFTDFLDDYVTASVPLRRLLRLDEPDFRMRDNELALRFLGFLKYHGRYAGDMKGFLDASTDSFNRDWRGSEQEIKAQTLEIDAALTFGMETFGPENFGRKWNGDHYERLLNRALLDAFIFYLVNPRVRDELSARRAALIDGFKALCSSNTDFRRSVEVTTKSLPSTGDRFRILGGLLRDLSQGAAQPLQLRDNRLAI